jgi:twitching motility two-component system response regulator PilG
MVEDDADSAALMQLALGDLPLTFELVPTGAAAMAALAQTVPDLLFLDIELPDMHGWEVLDRFKNDERLANLQVVVLTSHRDAVHRLIGMFQPIAAYLTKPVHLEALRTQVRELLDM